MKYIEDNHPVDPDTKEQFGLFERITVKDYWAKIGGGVFMCYGCIRVYQNVKRGIRKRLNPNDEKQYFKDYLEEIPSLVKIMEDSNDDESSEEDDKAAQGINVASRNLSESAFLYLQSLKTLVILFSVLTLVNLPVMYIYQSNTDNNNFGSITEVWKYFTIGNLG